MPRDTTAEETGPPGGPVCARHGFRTTRQSGETMLPTRVVALAVSEEGLGALAEFLEHVPSQSGLAFVIVEDTVLQRAIADIVNECTRMPIRRTDDETPLEPDTIYVIPPGRAIRVSRGWLSSYQRNSGALHSSESTFDAALSALADGLGNRAIAVFLGDVTQVGTRGALAIHERGGLVLAQRPSPALSDSVSLNALSIRVIDGIAESRALPAMLFNLAGLPAGPTKSTEATAGSPFDEAGTANIARDMTLRTQLEQATRRTVQMRDEFLAMLSHELRNPLAAIQNATHLLSLHDQGGDALAIPAGVIRRQVEHMARLLDDLLDVSRMARGSLTLRRQVVDVRDVALEVVEAVTGLVNARGQRLTVSVPDNPMWMRGDRARIRQIQENLLANASKYTKEGGQIWLELKAEGDIVVLRVRDAGRGIPADMLEAIFEPFTRVGAAAWEDGAGLGLTLVRTLVTLHGGTIVAQSDGAGRGSVFEVTLPRFELGSDREVGNGSNGEESAGTRLAKHAVVIVDDDESVRATLKLLLELYGFDVRIASDGDAFIDEIARARPDTGLIGVKAPALDGCELARRVRRRFGRERLRLVALTGSRSADEHHAIYQSGFDAHLERPVDHDELRTLLGP
jgi:signal transduction histidine kinase